MSNLLKIGDRIRIKVPTMTGWRGLATVTEDMRSVRDGVSFVKDCGDPADPMDRACFACRHEVAKLRDQTPRPGWPPERLRAVIERYLERGDPVLTAATLLRELVARGITLTPYDGLILVSDASRLADADRAEIRALKPDLLRILAYPRRPSWMEDAAEAMS